MMTKSVRRCVLVVTAIGTLLSACDRGGDDEVVMGEGFQVDIEGLRSLIEREVASGEQRILVVGSSGRDMHGRLLWADRDGTLIQDLTFEQIRQPRQMVACVQERDGYALFVTQQDDLYHTHQMVIANDLYQPDAAPRRWPWAGGGDVQLGLVGGSDTCGVCGYQPDQGRLSCLFDFQSDEVVSFETGLLGHWQVLKIQDSLALADWSADEEGWIAVRTGRFQAAPEEGEFVWSLSYRVGQLPSLANADPQFQGQPRFVATSDAIQVVFVDGTEWFTRIFVQTFPLDAIVPLEAVQLESCRGTCGVNWSSYLSDATWIWYGDRSNNWAERIAPDQTRTRIRFYPPDDVVPVGPDLFKMGLGNTLANWWALVSHNR